MVWILVGVGVTIGAGYLRTRYGYRPLQRLYLKQYISASIKSFLPLKKPSKYTVLVRVIRDPQTGKHRVFGCTDDQVTPLRDETGRVKFDPKFGPYFELQPGIPHQYFYWRSLSQMDKQMYVWYRDRIYDGRSLIGLYWICLLPLPFILAGGMFVSVRFDLKLNQAYEAGDLLRGVRLLKPQEYSREIQQLEAGIGIPVLVREAKKL
jgi:hypothetical protein